MKYILITLMLTACTQQEPSKKLRNISFGGGAFMVMADTIIPITYRKIINDTIQDALAEPGDTAFGFIYGPLHVMFTKGQICDTSLLNEFVNDTLILDMQWPIWKLGQLIDNGRLYSADNRTLSLDMWYDGMKNYSTGIGPKDSVSFKYNHFYSYKDFPQYEPGDWFDSVQNIIIGKYKPFGFEGLHDLKRHDISNEMLQRGDIVMDTKGNVYYAFYARPPIYLGKRKNLLDFLKLPPNKRMFVINRQAKY